MSVTITELCTCDDHCDDPCPRHGRESQLQYLNVRLIAQLREMTADRDACDQAGSRMAGTVNRLIDDVARLKDALASAKEALCEAIREAEMVPELYKEETIERWKSIVGKES